ncbi:TSUP family transporter [Brevibacterium sp. 5221]|uniref:Probable membrane transporter protein n=1 Tax=Brevibacterium rongguiense TaxID=2695267 RepID=A0A6N9H5Q7_9MICO|nr:MULTISPECIES: sulfite exporter TauE/SafE family protein [Brevibacterium]MYM19269.1 TSUP family transporter [Brevibacterium rongguiense]WAL39790.1 sulfite exporter TauE/SafE family protein [Brevibacterium sp. BRM-1]
MTAAVILIAVAAVFVGSTLQRLSGTGVGLVVAPTLALAMGPHVGVFVANSTTVISGFLIMLAVIREVDWKRFWILAVCAALGAFPAALLVRDLSSAWLNIVVGAVVLFALALTFGMPRLPRLTSSALTAAAGIVGGFLNTSAGVAAPAMVIYARFARWEQRSFAATLQPTFMTMGILSVAAKLSVGATTIDQLPPWWLLPIIVITVLLGIWLGGRLARRVPAPQARRLAIALAGLGGAVAIVRGALMLVA